MILRLATATILLASVAHADSRADAKTRLEAITDDQLFGLTVAWMKDNSQNCLLPMSREIDQRMQRDVEAAAFDMADVAAAYRDSLQMDLNDRIEGLLEASVESGVITINQDSDGISVTVPDCG